MAHNFWFDAFKADKSDNTPLPPLSKDERIQNLRNGIDSLKSRIASNTSAEQVVYLKCQLATREVNISRLLSA